MRAYLARWILTVATPPVESGAVLVADGRVAAVRPRDEVVREAAGVEIVDLGDVALVPGLVNAHTHLELSWLGTDPPAGEDYVTWVRELLRRRAATDEPTARGAAEEAVRFLWSRGTAAVGDVSNDGWAASVLARSPLRGVSFHEIYGARSRDAEAILERAASALDVIESDPAVRAARDRISVVLTPHAPHTTSSPLLKALAGRAAASSEPLSIHVAESEPEVRLFSDGSGPLAALLRERNQWEDGWVAPRHSPIAHLDRLGALTRRTLAVHCVHLGRQDISTLQTRGVTVVTCPRSNTRLGVGTAPVPKLLASGIPVALGTDSLASAPDLDLFEEMAALRAKHPGLAPAAALRIATLNGARALGLGSDLGSIEPGKIASLVAIRLERPGDDPLEVVTSGPRGVAPVEDIPRETVSP